MDLKKLTIGEIVSLPVFNDFQEIVGEENPAFADRMNGITIGSYAKLCLFGMKMSFWKEWNLYMIMQYPMS